MAVTAGELLNDIPNVLEFESIVVPGGDLPCINSMRGDDRVIAMLQVKATAYSMFCPDLMITSLCSHPRATAGV